MSEASIRLAIEGMHCAGCAARVEGRFKETPGVCDCAVNLATNTGVVKFDPEAVNVDELLHVFDTMSFNGALIPDDAPLIDENRRARDAEMQRHDWRVFAISAVITVCVVCLCMIQPLGTAFEEAIESAFGISHVLNFALLALTIPVQFCCGWRFYKGAVGSLRDGGANMDVLVALGTSVAFLLSLWITFVPPVTGDWSADNPLQLNGGMPYYETCCMLITFVLLGKTLEARAKGATGAAIEALINLAPPTACVMRGGVTTEIPLAQVVVGDVVRVRPGDAVPVDGIVLRVGDDADCAAPAETVSVDESMLTGESVPVAKGAGDEVTGGTIALDKALTLRAVRVGRDSTLAKIVRAVQDAQGSKAPVQRLADKIASIFVPTILGIALLTFIGWMLVGGANADGITRAILAAVAVIVVACPCALGLATPTALIVGMGKGAELGVLIRDGEALESLCRLKIAVFDKTGTLTVGVTRTESAGITHVNVADFSRANECRPDAASTLEALRAEGISCYMVSGDTAERAGGVARELGFDEAHVYAGVDPLGKGEVVRQILEREKAAAGLAASESAGTTAKKKQSPVCAFVGDGVNDAPAMAVADIGIAPAQATDVAINAGNVVLMHNRLADLPVALSLARATMRKIKQNLFWALIYNVIMIPLAAFGILAPAIAGAAMAFSSVTVVSNSLLLKRFKAAR